MDNGKQIKLGTILSYFTIIFNIAAGVFYTPWMIQEIGQSDYGIYGLATSLIGMFTVDCGLGNATARFISKYRAEKNEKKAGQFVGMTIKIYMILATVFFAILLVCFFLMSDIYKGLTAAEIQKLRVVYVIAGLFAVTSFPFQCMNGIFTAYEEFIFQKLTDLLNKVLIIVIMVIMLYNGYGLYTLVLVNAIVGYATILVKLAYLRRKRFLKIDIRFWNRDLLKEIFHFSLWLTISLLAENLIFNIMPTILGITSNSIEISRFTAASTIEGYFFTLTTVVSGMFIPRISRMVYTGEENKPASVKEIDRLMVKVGRIQLAIVGCIISVFAVFGREFVNLWLKKGFEGTYETTILLVLPIILIASMGIADSYLTVLGQVKYIAYGMIAAAIGTDVFAFLLTPRWGTVGAGIAVFLGNLLGRIGLMNYFYGKKFHLNVKAFWKECIGKMAIPIVISIVLSIPVWYFLPTGGWLRFIVRAGIGAVIYLAVLWFGVLNREEKNLVTDLLKKVTGHK